MGFIDDIPDEKYDRKYGDLYLFKRLFTYMGQKDLPTFTKLILWLLVTTGSNVGIPYLIKFVIELIEVGRIDYLIYLLASCVALFYAINWLGQYRSMYLLATLSGNMLREVRKDCYDTLLLQDMAFYDENKSGKLVSRVTSDTDTIGNMVQITTSFMINILVMIVILVLLLVTDYILALIAISVLPPLFAVAMGARLIARSTSKKWRKTIAILNANVAESISGIEVTKSFSQEKEGFTRFKEINMNNYRAAYNRAIGISIYFPFVEMLFGVGTFLILYYGGYWTLVTARIDIATLIFFILMLNRFFFPLMQITQFFNQFEAGLAAVERIFSLMDSEPQVKEDSTPIPVDKIEGRIDFNNMTFFYLPNEPLYKDFDLTIPAGETCAIVGKTGGGKTTLVSLLTRFYDVKEGTISIDGEDIRKLKLDDYRNQIGIVLQDNILFSGTIEENIRYGKLDATREEILEAAEAVYASEFISTLPQGLDTEVGEKGTKLSEGQKQLVAFARALLSDPKILILDEATSAIDAYTESLIQEGLKVLLKGRTAIIIAHRLTTVENADRIILIDDAKIQEEGTHQELMKQKGKYWQLYDLYFRHQSLDYVEHAAKLV
ncbi:MAG: ABC transporter ATP-binding protein [Candidatus Heimdallarchaeota archaeon]|nr:ABC transporter ATP-binding protein [Candidatus Heimdallarchaeota archaeon]MCK4770303.1 ABC transporter ATP-binding protein [Candidatus Heimdallarchaeota archaeon]